MRKTSGVAIFDESIAEGAMDEEKSATDERLAASRKLTGKVNEAATPRFRLLQVLDNQKCIEITTLFFWNFRCNF